MMMKQLKPSHHPSFQQGAQCLNPLNEDCPPFIFSESPFPLPTSNPSKNNANTPPEQWGITVNQLNNFVGWCKEHPRWEWIKSQHKEGYVSLYEIDSFFVRPWTEGRGAGVALCMNSDNPKQVNLYLCHAWAEDVEELVQSVNRHCQAQNLDHTKTVIWCCIFAIYQNDDATKGITIKQQVQISPPPFEAGISTASKKYGTLLCHTQHKDVCSRLWCIFEIFKATSALDDHGYASLLHIGCSDAFLLRLIAMWRLGHHHLCLPRSRDAKCTVDEDRHYITLQLEQVNNGWMKVDSAVYLARLQLAKLGCHLDEQSRVQESNLLRFEREFSDRHARITPNSSWIKLKAAVMCFGFLRKPQPRVSIYGATTKMRGFGDISPTESSPPRNTWGHQNSDYKKSISPFIEVEREGEREITFSYDRVQALGRVLPSDLSQHLWSAIPYNRSGQSTAMASLTTSQLFQISFGIKQHGKFYLKGERIFDGDYYDGQIEGGGKPIFPDQYPSVTIPHDRSYHLGTMKNCSCKRGRGTKLSNYGPNGCINAVVTRFDKQGNLQMMVTVRPDDAADDAGEFQLTSNCFSLGSEHGFETCTKDSDGRALPGSLITQVKGPIPSRLASGINVDKSGKIQNEAVVYARAAIFEKHFYHKTQHKDVHASIGNWNFYKLGSGIVDDTCNTDEAWVETSIVVHHITGCEGKDELSLFETSSPPPGCMAAGLGIWRSIESAPKGIHSSQYAFVDRNGQIQCKIIPVKQRYNPYAEYDLWYGDHSFMAALIGDFVKMHYAFKGPAEFGFGKSQCIPPYSLQMSKKV